METRRCLGVHVVPIVDPIHKFTRRLLIFRPNNQYETMFISVTQVHFEARPRSDLFIATIVPSIHCSSYTQGFSDR